LEKCTTWKTFAFSTRFWRYIIQVNPTYSLETTPKNSTELEKFARTDLSISKTALKPRKFWENNMNKKHAHFSYLLDGISHAWMWQTVRKWQPKYYTKNLNSAKQSLVYLKLLLYRSEFGKSFWTKKFRNFHSFPTVYHMHHSDKYLEYQPQNIVRQNMEF
jgi:hypothetical protein